MSHQPQGIIPTVDLVVVIDTSPSMQDEAESLSQVASSGIEAAKSSCPSDLRVAWFGIEGTWNGTRFDRTIRDYLTYFRNVPESQIRGRKRGEVAEAGAQEDGARAIEDISRHFDWRVGATRAILYLGDEALEGGGGRTDKKDIEAANIAIKAAKHFGVTVHTYFGTSNSKHQEGTRNEYARVAQETGGQSFIDKDSIGGFAALLEKVICGSRPVQQSPQTQEQISVTSQKTAPETEVVLRSGMAYVQDCVSNQISNLYTLDLGTGKANLIGAIATGVTDIAFVGSELYGLAQNDGTQGTQLLKIDYKTGKSTVIGNVGFSVTGLAYRRDRNTLYATTVKQLIAIDINTGAGTPVKTVADRAYNCGEVAFDDSGKAYITLIGYDKKKLLATCDLNSSDTEAIHIGDIGFPNLASMEFYEGVLYGVTGKFFDLGVDGQLIKIDQTTGAGTLISMTDPMGRWAGFSIYHAVKEETIEQNLPQIDPPIVNPTVEFQIQEPLVIGGGAVKTPKLQTSQTSETTPIPNEESQKQQSEPIKVPFVTAQKQTSNQSRISLNIDALSFDSFGRNPMSDIVCVTPVRTIVRREEEIILIRRVRKVEEIDASPACPVNTTQIYNQ